VGRERNKNKRERERSGGRETDRELSKLFIFYHHSTIASIFQSQTESLTNFVKNSSFIFSSKRKKERVVYLISFLFSHFFLSLSVGTIM
jgi:putative flippase GtrA